jgi:WD40 repeat protein
MHGFSSNGQRLLTESNFGTGRYYLFDVAGKKLLQFEGRLAEFSPNGQRVITMLRDKDYFQLYDAMGKKLAQLPGTVLKSPIFSQNSQRLVTFTENNAYLFNASGRQIAQMQGRFRGFGSGFDSTGHRLILYREDPVACTLFNSSSQVIAQLPRECMGVSPDSKKFLTQIGDWDNSLIHLYDFSGQKIAQLSGFWAVFTRDERFILTSDFIKGDSSYLYDSTGKQIAQLQGKNGRFSSNSKRLVTVSGNTVHLYDLSGKELARISGNRAAFLPKGEKFVTFLFGKNKQPLDISGGESRLFDGSGRELAFLKGDFDLTDIVMYGAGNLPPFLEDIYKRSLSFLSPDGQRFVTRDSKNSYLYDALGKQIAKLPGLSPRFSSTGQHFFIASEGKVYVFDRSGTKLIETQGEFGAFSPDGQRIAIAAKKAIP